ncbi:MAG: hypothetical protein SFU56_07080 [Capsulimonadales bacterium]|nr:hypothetical protein [Capsulimonadales bacterium]
MMVVRSMPGIVCGVAQASPQRTPAELAQKVALWLVPALSISLVCRFATVRSYEPGRQAATSHAEQVCTRISGQSTTILSAASVFPSGRLARSIWDVTCHSGDTEFQVRVRSEDGRILYFRRQGSTAGGATARPNRPMRERETRWLGFSYIRIFGWDNPRLTLVRSHRKTVGQDAPVQELLFNIGARDNLNRTLRVSLRESDGALVYFNHSHPNRGEIDPDLPETRRPPTIRPTGV